MTQRQLPRSPCCPDFLQWAKGLAKGLDILEHLSQSDAGLTQAGIARVLGRSGSKIFRMPVVLQDRGYIAFDPGSDRYVLTTLMFEIAHRTPSEPRRLTTAVARSGASVLCVCRAAMGAGD